MKLPKYFLPFIIFIITLSTSFDAKSQLRVGAGLGWGSEIEELGINFNGEYKFLDYYSGESNITIFFIEGNSSFWTLNLDGHYHFMGNEAGPYGLVGLNIATFELDFGFRDFDASTTEIGLNIGGGYSANVGRWNPFGDVKYVISDFDQLVIRVGVKYDIF